LYIQKLFLPPFLRIWIHLLPPVFFNVFQDLFRTFSPLSEIKKNLISKITASKKIERLIDLNLVQSYKSGRTKILDLTNEGKNIIRNRKE